MLQVVAWCQALTKPFEGVIALDECHRAKAKNTAPLTQLRRVASSYTVDDCICARRHAYSYTYVCVLMYYVKVALLN
eukprot:5643537-Pleurochrysis_carterae.AAC.2